MQQDYQLPDEQRREELRGLLNNLETARDHISPNDEAVPDSVSDELQEIDSNLHEIIEEVISQRSEIPEWDSELVRNIVLGKAHRRDTTVERADNEIVFQFEVGPLGDETKCRYAVGVTSGNEWFHVERNGDWEEVWTN